MICVIRVICVLSSGEKSITDKAKNNILHRAKKILIQIDRDKNRSARRSFGSKVRKPNNKRVDELL
jgi:hypothetical protein